MSIQQMLLGASGASGYLMDKSLRFRSSASAFLSRTTGTATNQNKWTWSGWVKRGTLGTVQVLMNGYQDDNNLGNVAFVDDCLQVARLIGGSVLILRKTNAVFRDPSAWYHVVVVFDNANATVADRVQIYVNSVLQTYSTSNDPSTSGMFINANSTAQRIGRSGSTASPFYFDGHLAEVNFIDGQALTPASFGETNALTGVWQPKAYTGTYGTNGFYLDFETTTSVAALGTDKSGNGNTWTVNNVSLTAGVTYDSMTDVPTLTSATAANYCVWNAAAQNTVVNGTVTRSNGNLTSTDGGTTYGLASFGTIASTTGKWYWEVTLTSAGGSLGNIGIVDLNSQLGTNLHTGIIYNQNGNKATGSNVFGGGGSTAYGATYTTGDVIAVALDLDAGTITFYKNNVSQGVAYTGISGNYTPGVGDAQNSTSYTFDLNCGQRPFAYTPPTGFVALNTFNLPTSTIVKGNTVMDAVVWTGTNSSAARSVTGLNFKPDFVWPKGRGFAYAHQLYDSVRGVGKALRSDATDAEVTNPAAGYLSSFDANGFSSLPGGSGNLYFNDLQSYVAWCWQAGQGTTSSNTNGSITSTVSVNATAGFSVVTFTAPGVNATIGHGLGVAPKMIILKARNQVASWGVYHSGLPTPTTGLLLLNTADAVSNSATYWNSTNPSSTVFSLGTAWTPSINFVAYCFAEIEGFSKFGSYTGNGSSDGPFIYLGFRPKFIMWKRTNDLAYWVIQDTSRNPYNVSNASLFPNVNNAEVTTAGQYDFLSNGFKIRNVVANETNVSGSTYVYAAFAESPFKNSLAR